MPLRSVRPVLPRFIAHADWGTDPRKRQVAVAEVRDGSRYLVVELTSADPQGVANGDVRAALHVGSSGAGQLLAGFDFPIGLPVAYADRIGITSFPAFLPQIGKELFQDFGGVATNRSEIGLHRPFYPYRPGGTQREHLYDGLGLSAQQLRRRCEGRDAETMFWTLGGKQVGKAALAGWRFLAASREEISYWPFDGPLATLLGDLSPIVVVETYPREFYRHIDPGRSLTPWSKTRQHDRLMWIPRLLRWAAELDVSWEPSVLRRCQEGFSAGPNGEDEFDAVIGLLGMIAAVAGALPTGEPEGDAAVSRIEGWILGRVPGRS